MRYGSPSNFHLLKFLGIFAIPAKKISLNCLYAPGVFAVTDESKSLPFSVFHSLLKSSLRCKPVASPLPKALFLSIHFLKISVQKTRSPHRPGLHRPLYCHILYYTAGTHHAVFLVVY